jgi:hypothetical protein
MTCLNIITSWKYLEWQWNQNPVLIPFEISEQKLTLLAMAAAQHHKAWESYNNKISVGMSQAR